MFGHGVFDSPLKTFNASPYCSQDSNKTAAEKVIGCPPWRGDYYNNYVEGVEPDWNSTWDEDAEIDRQFNLDTQQWQAKEKQLRDFMGLLFQTGGYGSNHELRWCHNEKYGTKLHWWLYDKDDTSTHAATSSMEASALSHSEVKGMMDIIKEIVSETDENLDVKETDCADEGMEENESFDYGPSIDSRDGDEDGEEPEDEEDDEEAADPSKFYYIPILLLLAGGAAYYYKDQLIQVSKDIM